MFVCDEFRARSVQEATFSRAETAEAKMARVAMAEVKCILKIGFGGEYVGEDSSNDKNVIVVVLSFMAISRALYALIIRSSPFSSQSTRVEAAP
jgi:hypothetical protein